MMIPMGSGENGSSVTTLSEGTAVMVWHAEELVQALRREWDQFHRTLEDELQRQFHRQELLIARYVASSPSPARAPPPTSEAPLATGLPGLTPLAGLRTAEREFPCVATLTEQQADRKPSNVSRSEQADRKSSNVSRSEQAESETSTIQKSEQADGKLTKPSRPDQADSRKPSNISRADQVSPASSHQSRRGADAKRELKQLALVPSTDGDKKRRLRREPSSVSSSSRTSISPSLVAALEHGRAPLRSAFYSYFGRYLDMIEAEPPRAGCLASLVESRFFEAFCAAIIISNGAFTVYTTNFEMQQVPGGVTSSSFIEMMEIVFMCFYSVELFLKLFVHRLFFFWCPDWRWNTFDFVLVGVALIDVVTTFLSAGRRGGGDGRNLSFMRSLRLLKMAKILRVVRVMRFFSELRLILTSLLGSVASLFWSMIMLALIFYIFSMVFVQGATSYLLNMQGEPLSGLIQPASGILVEEELCIPEIPSSEACVRKYFGSVQCAMLTLFQACTGGDDWRVFYEVVVETGILNSAMFIFFITFIQIALLNVLTGIFVDSAMKLAQPDPDTQAVERRKNEISQREELRRMFEEIDTCHVGYITQKDFLKSMKRGKLRTYLSILDLDVQDAERFFSILAVESDDQVDCETFIDGCMRLKGGASSLDMQCLSTEAQGIIAMQKEFYQDCMTQFSSIRDLLRDCQLTDPVELCTTL